MNESRTDRQQLFDKGLGDVNPREADMAVHVAALTVHGRLAGRIMEQREPVAMGTTSKVGYLLRETGCPANSETTLLE